MLNGSKIVIGLIGFGVFTEGRRVSVSDLSFSNSGLEYVPRGNVSLNSWALGIQG